MPPVTYLVARPCRFSSYGMMALICLALTYVNGATRLAGPGQCPVGVEGHAEDRYRESGMNDSAKGQRRRPQGGLLVLQS
jgi:hypothetical protein